MSRLELPRVADPDVSVVLVTYGGWDWPLRALEALVAHTDPVFEVVAVDNASPDGTADRLEAEVTGLRLLRNPTNEGFAAAADRGAREARAGVLCFLNPDALVGPGWLPPLLGALAVPWTGAAVPRFLGLDGRVQEAGSVVDRQGWTVALGAGADPTDPATRFPRAVDYGSAACLVISREAYGLAGGFDAAYTPAYCEDVDLAFALRAAGLHTRYEPAADVTHAGAGSTDEARRAELIERNRPLLLERWGEALAARPPLGELEAHPHRLLALRDALAPERLLFLADRLPGEGEPLERVLLAEAAARPETRFTFATPGGGVPGRLLAAGVEVAVGVFEPGDWLLPRRFHHSAVIAGAGSWRDWGPALRRTQPQAQRVLVASDGGPREADPGTGLDEAALADAVVSFDGAVPAADGRPAFAVPPDDPAAAARFLAWLGAAPPRRMGPRS